MKKTYIIGDVHGEYDTLVKLVEKLPEDAEIIFVGDLIDRGAKSREVIEFIRKNNYRCVLGNHEQFMIDYGTSFTKTYPKSTNASFMHTWYNNGGDATLFSYNLIKYIGGLTCVEDEAGMIQFKDDIELLKTLPLYIELPHKTNNKPVVISHASCANAWWQHDNPNVV
jgi:serine/threonine protein phosphatase 1